MSFLEPAMLAGIFAALIPPILHLIRRRRARRVQFAALEFILRSNRRTARRFKAKQFLLMALRSLLLALVAFALSRPVFDKIGSASVTGSDRTSVRLLVIDAGYTMGYELEGETLLDRARFKAQNLVDGNAERFGLLVVGEKVHNHFPELTSDREAVKRAIAKIRLSAHRTDMGQAAQEAYVLATQTAGNTQSQVLVFSTPNGANALPAPPRPGSTGVKLAVASMDLTEGAKLPNRAILSLKAGPAPNLGSDLWMVNVSVGNYSDEELNKLPIQVRLDGKIRLRGFLDGAAGSVIEKSFYFTADTSEAQKAVVSIESDALRVDDERHFWVRPTRRIRLLAVNGSPHPIPQEDEMFYFEKALTPDAAARARVRVTVADEGTFEKYNLADYDVLALLNFCPPSKDVTQRIRGFVEGGGGLLMAMGDTIKPDQANEMLGRLLPRPLRSVRVAGDAAASREGGDRSYDQLTGYDLAHPILSQIPSPSKSSLAEARVDRYMLLQPSPTPIGQVVLSLGDGTPYLMTNEMGRGRIALFTSTLDRDWGDLPIRPHFLPLIQEVLRYLTRVSEVRSQSPMVGQSIRIPVEDPRVKRVQIKGPDGDLWISERPASTEQPWRFDETDMAGHYRMQPSPPLPDVSTMPGFTVAVDSGDSDLRTAQSSSGAEDESERVTATAFKPSERNELWHGALLCLFAILLGEALLLWTGRKNQETLPQMENQSREA